MNNLKDIKLQNLLFIKREVFKYLYIYYIRILRISKYILKLRSFILNLTLAKYKGFIITYIIYINHKKRTVLII